MKESKITISQIVKTFIVAISAPLIRLIPSALSKTSKNAGIISPLLAIIILLFNIYIISKIFNSVNKKEKRVKDLAELLELVYGNIFGKVLISIYVIWCILLAGIHTRFFAERIVATTFLYAPIELFIISILALIYFTSRRKVENLVRFSEVTFYIFIIIAIVTFVLGMTYIKIENLLPITIYNTKEILQGTFIVCSIFSAGFLFLFIGKDISDLENLYKKGKVLAYIYPLLCMISIVLTIGIFGDKLASNFVQPFFMALKKITIFESIENIESIFISIWMIADFAIISYYVYVITYQLRSLAGGKKRNIYITPIIFIIYIISLGISKNYFSLAKFSSTILAAGSMVLCFVVPIITYFIARLRGIINKNSIDET